MADTSGKKDARAQARAAIIGAKDIQTELVATPEWAPVEELEVWGLGGAQRAIITQPIVDHGGKPQVVLLYGDLLVMSIHLPGDPEPLFGPEDKDELMSRSGQVLERLAKVALRLSGLTEEELAEAKKS